MNEEFAPSPETIQQRFAREVTEGLSKRRGKHIPSTWFYDSKGSELFKEICKQPEYYLTACEREIFETHGAAIMRTVKKPFLDVLELGCGDGHKTAILLKAADVDSATLRYIPVDISRTAVEECVSNVRNDAPSLNIQPIVGDFYDALVQVRDSNHASMLMFLGSNIGNMEWGEAQSFLKSFYARMQPGDFFFIGLDLIKDPKHILEPAYADAAGVTAAFNKNLLTRINNELGGTFDIDSFDHYAAYNFHTNAMESFLYSKKDHSVWIEACRRSFHFDAHESLFLERSSKYTLRDIQELASSCGFQVIQNYSDSRGYFVDSLWQKAHDT